MRKLLIATALSAFATSALAGGYVAPVVEPAPVVVQKSSSSSSIWIPIAILVLIGLAVSHHGHDDEPLQTGP
ncbi:MAG: hypothetical protein Q8Q63_15590 [Phaeovulum sp.]|uniref:hypothetical protein n=1 Tax=Phaeovulum sp. TaxID=2934796 RepID=UPI00272F0991|nr:hypothetical protein [Phaeovulum sp.]MDP2064263.1 hypothetical protein [Phaeovulum sp.]MDP3862998.1 hypothetical protein [Phaeovulum sp.]